MFYSYPSVVLSYIKIKVNRRYLLPLVVAIGCLILTPASEVSLYSAHAVHTSWAVIGWVVFCQVFSIKSRGLVFGLLIVLLVEMVTYRTTIYKMADLFLTPFPKEYRDIRMPQYQPTRIDSAASPFFHFKPLDIYAIGTSYLQEDSCPAPRQDIVSVGVKKLFDVRQGKRVITDDPRYALDPREDSVLKRTLGCNVPKLRLVNEVLYSTSEKEAVLLVGTGDIYNVPVITLNQSHDEVPGDSVLTPMDYAVTEQHFSANRLDAMIENKTAKTAWLIYADAYNSNWHVTIDGLPRPIYPANFAFKAVQIEPGKHDVRFVFIHNTVGFILFGSLMIVLACVVLGVIGWQAGGPFFREKGHRQL